MSVAVYITSDKPELQDRIFVDGKTLGRHHDSLRAIAEDHGLRALDSFFSLTVEEAKEFLIDELGATAEQIDESKLQEQWFTPEEGMQNLAALKELVAGDTFHFKGTEKKDVLEELDEFMIVMQTISDAGAKWHLSMDY